MDFFHTRKVAQQELLSQVCKLFQLLAMYAINAVSDRSFSALQIVKTYLRSTMAQDRLNHTMILHIHRELTNKLNLIELQTDSFLRMSIDSIFLPKLP